MIKRSISRKIRIVADTKKSLENEAETEAEIDEVEPSDVRGVGVSETRRNGEEMQYIQMWPEGKNGTKINGVEASEIATGVADAIEVAHMTLTDIIIIPIDIMNHLKATDNTGRPTIVT